MKKNILVPIDFSERSFKTLEQSYNLAKLLNSDITLLHVRQDTKKTYFFSLFSEEETQEMKKKYIEKLHLKLKSLTELAMKKYKVKINAMLAKGRTFEKVIEIAETVNAELIFIDKHTAEGNAKDYIGTNASRIVRMANCPVLINNDFDFSKGIKTIVLPIDLTEGSRQKVSKTVEIASICNSNIKVVSGLFDDDKQKANQLKVMIKQVEKYISESGIPFTSEIIVPPKNIKTFPQLVFDYSEKNNADLIVIITQQETGWVTSYISPNAFEVIKKSPIPVLSITPKDINFVVAKF